MTIGIYCIENKINGKRYIGQSCNIEKRMITHKHLLTSTNQSKDVNRHLYQDVQTFGWSAFKWWVIETFETVDRKAMVSVEAFYMTLFATRDREFGYNLRMDTDQMHCHEETRELHRQSTLGDKNPNWQNHWSDEQKDHLRKIKVEQHKTGEIYGDEWKSKISKASTEMWKDETKLRNMAKKVSKAKRKFKFHQFTRDGVFVKTWDSVEDIIAANPGWKWQNIYSACNGYKPTYRGFKWTKELKI